MNDGFKLCSCDPDTLESPDWTLSRTEGPRRNVRGRMAAPVPFGSDDRARIFAIESALRTGTCFDFDYQPAEGDVLMFHHASGRDLRFVYQTKGWTQAFHRLGDPPIQRIAVGSLSLPSGPEGHKQQVLIDAICTDPESAAPREVAEDYLREQGRIDLADWLRQERLAHEGEVERLLYAVAPRIEPTLRAKLARGTVASCEEGACPGSWERLPMEEDAYVRSCATCQRQVIFVSHHPTGRNTLPNGPHVLAPSLRE